jgi:FkbM family methyltransferase
MRKIFIDCGAFNGDSLERFYKKEFTKRSDVKEFEVYAFEPQSYCQQFWKSDTDKVHFYNEAVWVSDGEIECTINNNEGSNTDPDHVLYNTYEKEKVKAVDISKFIKHNFEPNDYIIFKMNIEGAEFRILDKLIKDGTYKMINEWFVMFHAWLFSPEKDEEETRIRGILGNIGDC